MARYAKKNNFTDKIQQILPSKSVKNSGTLVDQDNPKNLLEKLILNTTILRPNKHSHHLLKHLVHIRSCIAYYLKKSQPIRPYIAVLPER